MTLARKSLLVIVLVAAALIAVPASALGPCTNLGDEWDLKNGEVSSTSGSLVLKASNNMLRHLNNEVFGGWTRGSEYLSDVMHFLFQYHLDIQVRSHSGVRVMDRTLEYIKTLDVGFRLDRMKRVDVVKSVELAKAAALKDLHRYVAEGDANVQNLLRRVTGAGSELGRSNHYVFSEGRRYLEPLSPADMLRLRRDVGKTYPDGNSFTTVLGRAYGLGLGRTSWDAEFAAKLSSMKGRGYGPAVFFDNVTLYRVVRGLKVQRDHLDWLFAGQSEASLLQIFKSVRTNLSKNSPAQWTQSLREIIGKHADLSTPAGREQGIRMWRDVQKFVRTLNVLDYLPVEWAKVDPAARVRFNSLKNPDGVLFMDFVGLGARNYLAMYRQIDGMHGKLAQVERLMQQRGGLGRSETARRTEVDGQIHTILESVVAAREKILQPTNDYLVNGKNAVARVLERMGLGKLDYSIWASGDDMFVIFKNNAATSVDPMRVARFMAGESSLGANIRIAAMKPGRRNTFSLDQARATVGRCADPLKEIEALRLPYQVVMEFVPGATPRLVVGRMSGGNLTRLPPSDFATVFRAVEGWTVQQVP